MALGTLGKVIFLIFLINMGIYIFGDAIGIEGIIENDLFHNTLNVSDDGKYGMGGITSNVSGSFGGNPLATQEEQTGISFKVFDPLKNAYRVAKLFGGTFVNILGAPISLMTLLTKDNVGMPREIAIMIFAPLMILVIIGIFSFFRGKDV